MINSQTKQTAEQANGKVIILPGMQQEVSGVPYFNARLVDSYGHILKTFKINPETMRPFSSAEAKEVDIVTKVDFTAVGGHSWLFTEALPKPQVKSCNSINCVICSNSAKFDIINSN